MRQSTIDPTADPTALWIDISREPMLPSKPARAGEFCAERARTGL
jgi:hypothetical protein